MGKKKGGNNSHNNYSYSGTGGGGQRLGHGGRNGSGSGSRGGGGYGYDWWVGGRGKVVGGLVAVLVALVVVGLYDEARVQGGGLQVRTDWVWRSWTRWVNALRDYLLAVEQLKKVAKVVKYTFELPREQKLKVFAFGKGSSSLHSTTLHPVKSATEEERGETILVIHGSDGLMPVQQAVISTNHLLRNYTLSYLVIVVARPGYQSVPIKSGVKQPTEQADLYATLLEELDIPSAIVISYGTGIQSAVAFASKYPDMCRLLVAIDAAEIPPKSLLSHSFYTYFVSIISSKFELLWRGGNARKIAQEAIAKELIFKVERNYLFTNDDLGLVNDVNTLIDSLKLDQNYRTPTLVLNGCNAVPQTLKDRSDIETVIMQDAICSYANGIIINPVSVRKILGQFIRKHTANILVF